MLFHNSRCFEIRFRTKHEPCVYIVAMEATAFALTVRFQIGGVDGFFDM
jgi:hypothetical protein